MDIEKLRALLEGVREGSLSIDRALERLKSLPYEDLGFAKVDHHRHLRKGTPEVVFCQGKTVEQVVKIVERLIKTGESNILATRASEEVYQGIKQVIGTVEYHSMARVVVVCPKPTNPQVGCIALISAGTADLPVAEEAAVVAETLGNRVERIYDVGVAGLHRLLDNLKRIVEANVIIVVAGMEGALPSVVGGLVDKPIIAVPTSVGYGASFHGLSALLTMLNSCAPGISVVNIDNGFGAAYQASLINKMCAKS
ncbi:MAG TPA: nickel pincer cofactor biosynthesis protein LarB [Candidatus Limnocylindrales bacterium]|nr:nickel pincer cofactor biosynthesis protein LarB [Candidatus Limnocylindrales bacterium]